MSTTVIGMILILERDAKDFIELMELCDQRTLRDLFVALSTPLSPEYTASARALYKAGAGLVEGHIIKRGFTLQPEVRSGTDSKETA